MYICTLTLIIWPQYTNVNAWVPASFETPSMIPSWMKLGKKKATTDGVKEAKPEFRQVISLGLVPSLLLSCRETYKK